MINVPKLKLITCNIYIIAIILSILCSIITMYNALPNNDGITYLKSAEKFLQYGFKEAFISYHWPFYPILIAVISKFTNITLLNAAYILNALLQAGIVVSFLRLFKRLSNSNTMLWLALLTIIIFPQFNEYRHYILRDYGFWLFSLLGIINLIDYCSIQNTNSYSYSYIAIKYIALYFINFTIAFLFRSEAILIGLTLPLGIIWLNLPYAEKKSKLIKLYTPVLILGLVSFLLALVALVAFIAFHGETNNVIYEYLYNNSHFRKIKTIVSLYYNNIEILNHYIFFTTPNNIFTSIAFFIFGLSAVFIIKFITTLNIINVFLLIIFFKLIWSHNNNIKLILFSSIITIALPLAFLFIIFITSGRYYMLGCFLFLLFIPFSLHYLWQLIKNHSVYNNYKISVITSILIILIYMTLSGLVSTGPSKEYIRQAGLWYKEQNLPTEQAMSNSAQLNYFAGINENHIENLDLNNTNNFKYLLIKVKYKDLITLEKIKELEQKKAILILNKFNNNHHDTVFIIQQKPSPP